MTLTHSALGLKQRHHGVSSEVRHAAGDSRCTQLASFDGRMQQAARTLGIGTVQELGLDTDQRGA